MNACIFCVIHVFWIFSRNRLAAHELSPGVALLMLFFLHFDWLVSDVVVFGLNSYCTYINCMMNYCLQ